MFFILNMLFNYMYDDIVIMFFFFEFVYKIENQLIVVILINGQYEVIKYF